MTFTCTGKECLDCPLKDCIRNLCETKDGFINTHILLYDRSDNKKAYSRAYYAQNKEKIKERNRKRYHEKKARDLMQKELNDIPKMVHRSGKQG